MEMASKITRIMFKAFFLFSLVSARRGDVLALGNPFMEKGILKGKVDAFELK